MLILIIKTDQPTAEIGLYQDRLSLTHLKWLADRQLAETIHQKIEAVLETNAKSWSDLQGILVFKGPGSFTGLRIGLSVGNALAFGLDIPIVGSTGKLWIEDGVQKLLAAKNDKIVIPKYGMPPHITLPKK